jgi:hypothetical protein
MGARKNAADTWTDADAALWHTIAIAQDVAAGRVPQQRVPTVFPLRQHEVAFAQGPVRVDEWRAAGDGSYSQSSTFMFGTGAVGVGLGVGTLVGSAIGNARRRSQAEWDATPMFRPVLHGTITVTSQGFHLVDGFGTHTWGWQDLTMAQMADRTVVNVHGASDRGPVNWMICSDWAELVFVLWATFRHPQHPQFTSTAWVPAGWPERAAQHGFPLPAAPHRLPS